jgi:hypothetical protein
MLLEAVEWYDAGHDSRFETPIKPESVSQAVSSD